MGEAKEYKRRRGRKSHITWNCCCCWLLLFKDFCRLLFLIFLISISIYSSIMCCVCVAVLCATLRLFFILPIYYSISLSIYRKRHNSFFFLYYTYTSKWLDAGMMPEIRDDERHVPVLFSSSLSQKEFLFFFFFSNSWPSWFAGRSLIPLGCDDQDRTHFISLCKL
jgi:hypothetical protein